MRRSSPDFGSTASSGATGGAMRRTIGWSATTIVAAMMAAARGGAARNAASAPPRAAQAAGASPTISSEQAAPAAVHLSGAAFNEDADGARVVLSANAPLLYTSYEPRPDLLVVDLPGTDTGKDFMAPHEVGTLVSSIRFDPVVERGKPMTRISIVHREGVRSDVRSVGQGLAIAFEAPEAAAAAASPATQDTATSMTAQAAPPAPQAEPSRTVVAEEIGRAVSKPAAGDPPVPAAPAP